MRNFQTALLLLLSVFSTSVAYAQLNESNVVITEISYNPPESGIDSLEFIELYNVGSTAVNLNGYTFTQGIVYTFGNYNLAPGTYVVVAIDSAAMQNVFGVTTLQWTSGALSNSGETIELRTAASGGSVVDVVTYATSGSWPTAANGNGASLVLCDPLVNNQLAASWQAATTSVGVTINSRDVKANPNSNEPCPVLCPDITAGLSALVTTVDCNGNSTGTINLTVGAGASPFDFDWSNNATTEDISGLLAGTYTVTVTDANTCTGTATFNVTEPSALTVNTASVINVACNGGSNGAITLNVSGGTTPYSYVWSNSAATKDVANLVANTYSVTVTDANGCTATLTAIVAQPAVLTVGGVVTDVDCNGASTGGVNLTVAGGTPGYSYAWSNSATTQDITAVVSGAYSVTVTDANSCTASANFTINQPTALAVGGNVTNVACNNGNNGAIDITASGGNTPYTFAWSSSATTEDVSGLVSGSYTVTITDGNSCTASATFSVTQPTALVLSSVPTNVTCNGGNNGAVNLSVSGGSGPYTFAWSNSATTEDIANLVAGTYSVTVTDNSNCTATGSYTVTEPSTLTLTGTETDASCGASDGSVDVTVVGGVAPYTFAWSNNAVTEDLVSVSAGNYTITVTDNNGCNAIASYTVSNPTAQTLSAITTDVACNGEGSGAIDLTVTGGATPYTYVWSNAATAEDLVNVAAGSYSVTVTDNNGCVALGSYDVNEPIVLVLILDITDASCLDSLDGGVEANLSGGTIPYTYTWSNNATTANLTNIGVGTYALTVTDDNGCTTNQIATVSFVDSCIAIGIAPVLIENGISIYPNPAADNIMLKVNGNWQAVAITIQSFSGAVVLQQAIDAQNGSMSLQLGHLAEGIYLVTVEATDGRLARTKLMVTK